ncbi:MAG TPA: glycosyl hydrolase 53 family protein [Chthonomonas sp.]|uniref:glycoside hydrolase family 53 protein n=1 Tax=Chthonomonas sp. TaxID=2282153 RepID=UPI002B4AC7B9|nr:glycosyl hydrolase 53 family protein [Chthonomonas sp.]HLH80984.1 glycosyl hydrolase 53 family protein [Chthonomonas sp.]
MSFIRHTMPLLTLFFTFVLPLRGLCTPPSFMIGADLSFLKFAEDQGDVFLENGKPMDVLQLLKNHGYNWIRLRLFVHPTDLPNGLEYTIALAKRAKALGYHFLLDLHYSDTWADPQHQITPQAWQKLSHPQLVQTVFSYTKSTLEAFRSADMLPDMVQIGNEISAGFLWPDGKLPANWDHFADLLKAGIAGVHAACPGTPCPKIMIHIDQGGNVANTSTFFNKLASYHIAFDVIGQSYYPWWQGHLEALRENMNFMATTYHKPIVIVETAYHWQTAEYPNGNGPFPETPDGQKQFLQTLYQIVQNTPNHLGAGIFWWEPAVPFQGPYSRLVSRSFFNDDHEALPVITAFEGRKLDTSVPPSSSSEK